MVRVGFGVIVGIPVRVRVGVKVGFKFGVLVGVGGWVMDDVRSWMGFVDVVED